MLVILSPTKIQNFEPQNLTSQFTQPEFMQEAEELVDLMRDLSPTDLSKLLDINANLTQLNFDRFFNWHLPFTPQNAKQAALAFDGEAFRGLDVKSFSKDDFEYAQKHLRILSGLYGVLRPLDLIQPYRLEVSSKLDNRYGKDLYAFWRDKVSQSVQNSLKASKGHEFILNLSSAEYSKTLNLKKYPMRLLNVEFYEYKEDKFRQVVIYVKKARGMMARYVIQNHIENEEDLKGFSAGGYWYDPSMSKDDKLVFVR